MEGKPSSRITIEDITSGQNGKTSEKIHVANGESVASDLTGVEFLHPEWKTDIIKKQRDTHQG